MVVLVEEGKDSLLNENVGIIIVIKKQHYFLQKLVSKVAACCARACSMRDFLFVTVVVLFQKGIFQKFFLVPWATCSEKLY